MKEDIMQNFKRVRVTIPLCMVVNYIVSVQNPKDMNKISNMDKISDTLVAKNMNLKIKKKKRSD